MSKQMPDCAALLQSILDITRTMRKSALDSDWDSVYQSEGYRQSLIEQCFPLDDSIANPARAADSIHEVIELDRSVMSLLALAREEIEEGLGKLKVGRQATNAYTAVEIGGHPYSLT